MGNTMTVDFEWENGESFTVTQKLNQEDKKILLHVDEDSCLKGFWAEIEAICHKCLTKLLKKIGKEMHS